MRKLCFVMLGASAVSLAGACGPGDGPSPAPPDAGVARPSQASGPLAPAPRPTGLAPDRVALGRELFHDRRLSGEGGLSCASCHDLANGGTDHRAHPNWAGDGVRDTPTVFNSSLNRTQFWDGRADSLEAQIDGPVLGAGEMAATWPAIVHRLRGDAVLVGRFQAAYGNGPDEPSIKDAIATFERSLVTVGARFDRFLDGDAGAISAQELEGYELFRGYGCVACHQGTNVGGNMLQDVGIYRADDDMLGRFAVTRDERDRAVLRVPSLRVVAWTAPYFHDGSAATLEQAVDRMAADQLGRVLPVADRTSIVAFLRALSDGAEVPR